MSSPRDERTTGGGDELLGLKTRLENVGQWMKQAKTTHPEAVGEMVENFRAAAGAMKTDLGLCRGLIEKLERVKNEFDKGISESITSESETEKTPDISELRSRLQDVVVFSKSLTDTDAAGRIQGASRLVLAELKANNLKDAEQKLLRLEAVVEKLGGKKTSGGTPPVTATPTPVITTTPVTTPVTTPQTPVITGQTPLTPTERAKGKFDAAKRGVEAFQDDPDAEWNTKAARQQIMTAKSEMLQLVTDEMNADDDVQRKGLVFDSKDKDYHKNVTAVVKATMEKVLPVLSNPTAGATDAIKTLEDAMGKLAIEKQYYGNLKGITETKMLDQRRRKVAAIDAHQKQMQKVAGKMREILKIKYAPMLNMLDTLPDLAASDPTEAEKASKEFAALLKDEAARDEFFQTVGKEHVDSLLLMIGKQESGTTDKLGHALAMTRAADNDFMDELCQKAITQEASKATDTGTFFRSNSLATKLSAGYARNSPAGKAYCQQSYDRFKESGKGKGSLEIDKGKNTSLTDKDVNKNVLAQKKLASSVIDDLTSDPNSVPPEIAKMAAQFYTEAKRVSGDDEEFATTQSGGFIVLRVLCPSILQNDSLAINEINDNFAAQKKEAKKRWVESGKPEKDFAMEMSGKDKTALKKLQEEQRLATLQTKLLQNISNGVEFGSKEPFMIPMNDMIKNGDDYTPEATKMRKFLKDVAISGGAG